jgi:hypothetical protein
MLPIKLAIWTALCAGCGTAPAPERETIVLTANDVAEGRGVVDLERPVRWVVDGTQAAIDLHQVEVVAHGHSVSLRDFLLHTGLVDEMTVDTLSARKTVLSDGPAPQPSQEKGGIAVAREAVHFLGCQWANCSCSAYYCCNIECIYLEEPDYDTLMK